MILPLYNTTPGTSAIQAAASRRASECGKQPINEHRALVAQPRSPVRTIKFLTSDPTSGCAVCAPAKRPHLELRRLPSTRIAAIIFGRGRVAAARGTKGGGRGLNGGTVAIDLRLRLGVDRKTSRKSHVRR